MWPTFSADALSVRSRGRAAQRAAKHRRPRLCVGPLDDRNLPSFLAPVDYAAGSSPTAVATEFINNDTISDLVVANSGSNTVSVLLGNADGTFQAAVNSATGNYPHSVAVGDFDKDGKLDVATANSGDVSVLLGNGDGTFQDPTNLYIGADPASVAVGDFNADGKMDLGVAANTYVPGSSGYWGWYPGYYVSQASVLLGNGDGSFAGPVTTSLGYGYHTGAATADFNADDRDDFTTANWEYGTADVLLADSTGSLQVSGSYYVGYYAGSVAASDLNGDLKADLVVGKAYGDNVSVLLGDGLGGFGTAVDYAVGASPTSIAIGDFNGLNGDGKLDIALSTSNGGLGVLLGKGDGTFTLPVLAASNAYLPGVVAGDFNGDGWLDAAAANGSGNSASAFINDHVWPALNAPSLSVDDVTVTEGNTGTVTASFTVSLSAVYGQTVTVKYATADGSATVTDGDYQAATDTLTFAPGETSKPVLIQVNGDIVPEWSEWFNLRLSDATNAFLADAVGVGTITDDEPDVSVSDGGTVTEGNSGTKSMTFTISLSAPTTAAVTVDYATSDGSASAADGDYQATSGTVTFAPGETSKPVTVLVNGDRVGEYDESFYLSLTGASAARIGDGWGYGNIQDDEPEISINSPAAITEGNHGTKPLTFTVSLSAAYDQPITVNFATQNYSAAAGSDYVATSGTLTFAPGETTKTFTVQIKGDKRKEYSESFYVLLGAPSSNALISNAYGWGTILDDDRH